MSEHNYAGCQIEGCQRCQDFNTGWAAGKNKAQWELSLETLREAHPTVSLLAQEADCIRCGEPLRHSPDAVVRCPVCPSSAVNCPVCMRR